MLIHDTVYTVTHRLYSYRRKIIYNPTLRCHPEEDGSHLNLVPLKAPSSYSQSIVETLRFSVSDSFSLPLPPLSCSLEINDNLEKFYSQVLYSCTAASQQCSLLKVQYKLKIKLNQNESNKKYIEQN